MAEIYGSDCDSVRSEVHPTRVAGRPTPRAVARRDGRLASLPRLHQVMSSDAIAEAHAVDA